MFKSLLAGVSLAAACWQAAGQETTVSLVVRPRTPFNVTRDDVRQLRHLASGVGWEFEPNAATTAALKRIGIKTIRCINVDPLPGYFEDGSGRFVVGQPDRLQAHLETCRAVGANPHIIIATGLHPDLRVQVEDVKHLGESVMGLVPSGVYGPKDWTKFQAYCRAYFEYVLLKQGFRQAKFEVANEPDVGGAMCPLPPRPPMGSQALYDTYFTLYKNVAQAARQFEQEHPGVKVRLGGPALAWAFTFRFGDFNWAERFLQDCRREKLKLDFIGVHYYGNLGSLHGEYEGSFPSFDEMLRFTLAARDRYCPGVPLQITEWGASYQTTNEPSAAVNANHIGAAWGAAFLNAMLEGGVESALYLVTTDLRQERDGKWENVWGWPSLFLNPHVAGGTIPKAPFHTLDMVSRLVGKRVAVTGESKHLRAFASADARRRRMTVLLWNYGYRIPEAAVGTEEAPPAQVVLRVEDAARLFGRAGTAMERWQVDAETSNAHALFLKGERPDARAELQRVAAGEVALDGSALTVSFPMPPSSVCLLTLQGR